jgi:hypothetical protein
MAKRPSNSTPDDRKSRLAEALRTNLKRRKAQARARAAAGQEPDAATDAPLPTVGQTSKTE